MPCGLKNKVSGHHFFVLGGTLVANKKVSGMGFDAARKLSNERTYIDEEYSTFTVDKNISPYQMETQNSNNNHSLSPAENGPSKAVLGHLLPKKIRPKHITLAERLYSFIPPQCWMTEANLAAALGTTRRQIRAAKAYLEATGQVWIELRQNGKRANPIHTIVKTYPINQYIRGVRSGVSSIKLDWSSFDNFAAKDLNQMAVQDLLEFYEEIGFQTIPIHFPKFKRDLVYCSCKRGRNCPKIGKHPALAWKDLDFSDKRTYREMRGFWEDDDRYNIGFKVEGYSVIDIDYRKGGHLSLGYLEEELGEIPVGLSVATGNGRHIYVQDADLPTSVEAMGLSGIDVRSSGGIVVAPCSIHASGNPYQWETIGEPEFLPESWSALLRGGQKTKARVNKQKQAVQPEVLLPAKLDDSYVIPEGRRNRAIFGFACRERAKGATYDHILDVISTVNETYCEPRLGDAELKDIAASANRYLSEAEKRQQGITQ
jgi:hypothetical protein